MASSHVERPTPKTASVPVTAGRVTKGAAKTVQHFLDRKRAGVAGGAWLLALYSASTVLFVTRNPPGSGMLPLWDALLPGFDGGSNVGVALGFPLSFLYGGIGAWFFAMLYNIAPPGAEEGTETT